MHISRTVVWADIGAVSVEILEPAFYKDGSLHMSEGTVFVGIDVSSDHFNVHILPFEIKSSWNMDAKSIKALIKQLKKVSPNVIAMESTGGYEIQLCAALLAEGLPALLVNPHRAHSTP